MVFTGFILATFGLAIWYSIPKVVSFITGHNWREYLVFAGIILALLYLVPGLISPATSWLVTMTASAGTVHPFFAIAVIGLISAALLFIIRNAFKTLIESFARPAIIAVDFLLISMWTWNIVGMFAPPASALWWQAHFTILLLFGYCGSQILRWYFNEGKATVGPLIVYLVCCGLSWLLTSAIGHDMSFHIAGNLMTLTSIMGFNLCLFSWWFGFQTKMWIARTAIGVWLFVLTVGFLYLSVNQATHRLTRGELAAISDKNSIDTLVVDAEQRTALGDRETRMESAVDAYNSGDIGALKAQQAEADAALQGVQSVVRPAMGVPVAIQKDIAAVTGAVQWLFSEKFNVVFQSTYTGKGFDDNDSRQYHIPTVRIGEIIFPDDRFRLETVGELRVFWGGYWQTFQNKFETVCPHSYTTGTLGVEAVNGETITLTVERKK